ncbi:MAG: outer membrane lipoprotein-sorting protein [Deltaproteobacteria bacterium]
MNQLVLVAVLATAPAASAELTAEQIAKQALNNNMFSTANAQADVNLTMSKNGKVVRERRIITKVLRTDGEVRSFVEFTSPSDVAGTRFLSVEEKGGDADQYIYLPAFKKVKRVVGSQRTRSFMGTDFSYADLDGRDPDAATYKRLADDKIGGQDCYVLEATPKHPQNEDYGKSVVWVHKKHLIPMRIDFYGKKGATVKKRFTVRRLEKKDGRWVATDSKMATLSRSTATQLVLVKVDFDQAIDPADLTRQALER